jgi:type IV pilus assembly protein PilB
MIKFYLERRLIGEIFVERGVISQAQLDRALEVQQTSGTGEYIGEILMRLGYLNEIDIVTALVLQCNLPYIAVSKHDVSPEVLGLIPADFARHSRLVPLDRIGNILSVVMMNPMDENKRQEVEMITGCKIATFISTRSEIDAALKRFYGEDK